MRSLPSSDPTGAVFEGRKIRAPARARRGRRRFMHMIRARAPVAVRSRPAVHVAVLNFAEGHLAPRARARGGKYNQRGVWMDRMLRHTRQRQRCHTRYMRDAWLRRGILKIFAWSTGCDRRMSYQKWNNWLNGQLWPVRPIRPIIQFPVGHSSLTFLSPRLFPGARF